jgi:hypothetical protein
MNANSAPDQNVPTKINGNGITDNITDTLTGRDGNTNTNDTPNNNADNNTALDMSQMNMPKMNP